MGSRSQTLAVNRRCGQPPGEVHESTPDRELLESALEGLSDWERDLIMRRDLLGYSRVEIADAIGAGSTETARMVPPR